MEGDSMASVRAVVFKESENVEGKRRKIKGSDFNLGVNFPELINSLSSTGFQATNLGHAIEIVNEMLEWKLADEEIANDCSEEEKDPKFRESTRCKIFLGFTSNIISSGLRETVRYLVEHRMVDVIVTTGGGIEEDLIKCLAPTFQGEFSLPGAELRKKGLNRIGNLLVPNDNYCKFDDWISPILDKMLEEQTSQKILWTPSKIIARLGREINDETSYLYWASKNNIPVFCPGLTDGSLGDMLSIHPYQDPGLIMDVLRDRKAIDLEAVRCAAPRKTGMIILGGGAAKHHICNANLMRGGADYAVFINTAQEFDGSDSGASPDEAVSWGKIRATAKSVKVHCDATIAFPLLVAVTFAPKRERERKMSEALMEADQKLVMKGSLEIEKLSDEMTPGLLSRMSMEIGNGELVEKCQGTSAGGTTIGSSVDLGTVNAKLDQLIGLVTRLVKDNVLLKDSNEKLQEEVADLKTMNKDLFQRLDGKAPNDEV